MKITSAAIEAFLNCPLKGYLKFHGDVGTVSELEQMKIERRAEIRSKAIDSFLAREPAKTVNHGLLLTVAGLKHGSQIILDAILEDEKFSFHFDGLSRVEGSSALGRFHYVPMLIDDARQIRTFHKRLLALHALVLAHVQGKRPAFGYVWHGRDAQLRKVRLDRYAPEADRLVGLVEQIAAGDAKPALILNEHCKVCEFQQRCHAQAVEADHLSLLRGITEKEIKRYARKGIFTVTQLSHTFRPRRKGKRSEPQSPKRQVALQAMAIRDRTIYVLGNPELPSSPVRVFLDVEADPDEGYIYLIGMLCCQGATETCHSFWADDKSQEREILKEFLATLSGYGDFRLYVYSGYEQKFLRRMRGLPDTRQLDVALAALFNVLSVIYPHIYFPTWSNGLKDVAKCLGFSWASSDASGLQSILWRRRWEANHDGVWKDTLVRYNMDDCQALKVVTDRIDAICTGSDIEPKDRANENERLRLTHVRELDELARRRKWGAIKFVHEDFSYINGCAYFKYQRQRVFARTIKRGKRKTQSLRTRNRQLRVTRRVPTVASQCESCGSSELVVLGKHPATGRSPRAKRAFDLTATSHGIKLSVIESHSAAYQCRACRAVFVPREHSRLARYGHGLQGWAMYQHVAHGLSFGAVKEMISVFFDVPIERPYINHFKTMMAQYYEPTRQKLLEKLLAGNLLHVDETLVKLKGARGYVWALTNLEEVVFLYRPNREGDFLKELLKSFHGVLVSDFYSVYDSIDCPQQKCLVHLIRDMNDDLLENPFDSELCALTEPFGVLLRAIVETIGEHGLRRSRLRPFRRQITAYFRAVESQRPHSDAAQALRLRLLKYRDKLFTFVDYDAVPWNNNNAENAIHRFALYRSRVPNMMNEAGLTNYLALLSVCHTCYYKGINFWRFLLSRCQDFDAYVPGKAGRRPPMVVDTYPDGYLTEFERLVQRQKAQQKTK